MGKTTWKFKEWLYFLSQLIPFIFFCVSLVIKSVNVSWHKYLFIDLVFISEYIVVCIVFYILGLLSHWIGPNSYDPGLSNFKSHISLIRKIMTGIGLFISFFWTINSFGIDMIIEFNIDEPPYIEFWIIWFPYISLFVCYLLLIVLYVCTNKKIFFKKKGKFLKRDLNIDNDWVQKNQ